MTTTKRMPPSRARPARWTEDALQFCSSAELKVYRFLKQRQHADYIPGLPDTGFTVVPNAPARLPGRDRLLVPDFLICYAGHVGVIEVDGPAHNGRASQDRSRDRLLEDAGIAYVDRLDVQDTDDPKQLAIFLDRFLHRITR